ncbi:MAG: hypothetical protein IMF19_15545 [Proteobacteria bacterium]|nr:hypothetical protein [Pseudomonadota bacterium]
MEDSSASFIPLVIALVLFGIGVMWTGDAEVWQRIVAGSLVALVWIQWWRGKR